MRNFYLFFSTILSLIVLAQSPKAKFTTSVVETAITSSTIKFINTSEGGYTLSSWSFSGGNPTVSTEVNPIVTYNTPGTYKVELTVTNSSGSSKVSTNLTVSAGGILDLTTGRKQDGTLYEEYATDFNWKYRNLFSNTDSIFNAATIPQYGQWSLPNRKDLIGIEKGRYLANRATNDTALKGNQHEYTRTFNLSEDGVLNFRALADDYVTIYLDGKELGSTFLASTSWPPRGYWNSWACDPRDSNTKEIIYDIPVSKGLHILKALVRNVAHGTGFTLNGNVKYGISITPVASFSADQVKTLKGTPIKFIYNSGGTPISYFWEFEDGEKTLTSEKANPSVLFENVGHHKVKLKVIYANGQTSTFSSDSYIEITPNSSMSIDDLDAIQKTDIQISPNPTSGIFKVLLKDVSEEGKIHIIDMNGKEIYSKPFKGIAEVEVNIENRPAGVYIVKIKTAKRMITQKVIKK